MNEEDKKEAEERGRRFAWCDDDVRGLRIIKSKNIASSDDLPAADGDKK